MSLPSCCQRLAFNGIVIMGRNLAPVAAMTQGGLWTEQLTGVDAADPYHRSASRPGSQQLQIHQSIEEFKHLFVACVLRTGDRPRPDACASNYFTGSFKLLHVSLRAYRSGRNPEKPCASCYIASLTG
jgi:hypothetical protein